LKNKISILLPVYNDEKFIYQSIKSIIINSYKFIEIVVINDGSTDSTVEIIKKIKDNRIKIYSKENSGLIDSLNYGLKKCSSEIIMRMDGDDEISKNKIEIQLLNFLKQKTVLMGTGGYVINNNSEVKRKINVPQKHKSILNYLNQLKTSIIHPSIMFYKDAIIKAGCYDSKFYVAEDYEMYYRMSKIGNLSNINLPLISLRKNEENISLKKSSDQLLNTLIARKVYIENPIILSVNKKLYMDNKEKVCNSKVYLILNFLIKKINNTDKIIEKIFYAILRKIALKFL
tara:strand:- start:37 stop:897 length:861 start_codon:yes stop_codon:yes gene_type:complete